MLRGRAPSYPARFETAEEKGGKPWQLPRLSSRKPSQHARGPMNWSLEVYRLLAE